MSTPQMQRSVPEVLGDIITNFEQIVRAEIRLARTEVKEEAAKAVKPSATFGAGVALGFYGLGLLLLAAVYALTMTMAAWLAALIVGVVVAMVGLALASAGRKKLKSMHLAPKKTIRSLEENVQWAKQQIK
jgi:uncharacterized membrane protein YqjE